MRGRAGTHYSMRVLGCKWDGELLATKTGLVTTWHFSFFFYLFTDNFLF